MKINKLIFIALLLFLKTNKSISQVTSDTLSVFFERNVYSPNAMQLQEMNKLISKHQNPIDSIYIHGYSSSFGNEKYNLRLSRQRAIEIKKEILKITGSSKIVWKAFGEQQGLLAKHRRVDILLYSHKQASKVIINEKRVLKGVKFISGKDIFTPESESALLELVTYAKDNKELKFRFIGHICCSWNRDPNEDDINRRTKKRNLSESRAKAVYDFLIANSIDKKRLSYIGKAYTEPLGGESHLDRRVEIEIIKPEKK